MAERRRPHRREPIIVEVRGVDWEAHPLPWMDRNDLGDEILKQYSESLNQAFKAMTDPGTNAVQVELKLSDKLLDPHTVVLMAYPQMVDREEDLKQYDWDELRELIYAALEVNHQESLKELVDPNFRTPTEDGGTDSAGRVLDILKRTSGLDSELLDSALETLEDSPMESSASSSQSSTEETGNSDTGESP